jgi:2-keto-4-pentenoate hydratase/2-oxohepta-3-ene-1,7-dioic acid hydratase in catechol pathway
MRILSFSSDGALRLGVLLSGERVLDVTNVYPTALALLEAGDAGLAVIQASVERAEAGEGLAGPVRALHSVTLRPPVPQARKLLAVAQNYREHIREVGRPTFAKEETYPYFFLKPPSTTLTGSGGVIRKPEMVHKLDYEAELCLVIGRRGRDIAPEHVLDHVAGYTILNDVTDRGLASKEPPKAEREQNRFFDWLVGKWFDTAAPCGPWLVTRDEIEDPHNLRIRTRVNGEVRQDGTTAAMIFSIPELVAFISRVVTLEPGDLIATGTPSGVGHARGVYLQPGDEIEIEIERIGLLKSRVEAA